MYTQRGIGNYILRAIERHPRDTRLHFFISSGGNAGLAAVLAAQTLGYPCTVVVPQSAKAYTIRKLEISGAERVVQHGSSWREADTYLRETVMKEIDAAAGVKAVYVPPFDAAEIWDGAATMVDEWERQLAQGQGSTTSTEAVVADERQREREGEREEADVVICSVGGGGLFSGLCQGLETAGSRTQVIAVETKGADSLNQSVKAEYLVTLPGITSIATSLGATQVCSTALAYALEDNVSSVVVSDKQAVHACLAFAEEERMLVEPACGASLAIVYSDLLKQILGSDSEDGGVRPDMKVVVVVCGGSNVGLDTLSQWKRDFEL